MLQPFSGPIGWTDPYREFRRIQEDLNRAFGNVRGSAATADEYPPVNVWTGEQGMVVAAEIPGVSPDDLDISVQQNTLVLKGKRQARPENGGLVYHRKERPSGSFSRSLSLPFEVDATKVDAEFRNGILTIHLPRPAAEQPRRIAINTA